MKSALITGASSGLGAELARILAKKGYKLILTGRDEKRLARIAASLGAEFLACDLAKNRTPLLDLIRKRCPDLVINNAGFTVYGDALSHPLALQQEIAEVNAMAALEIALESANTLKVHGKKGVILNVSSLAGELSFPSMAVYSASKAFLTSLSKSLDAELRVKGIRVLVSLPGQIATPFAENASRGRFRQSRSPFTLTPCSAAKKIVKQIERQKGVSALALPYRLAKFFAKLSPRRLLERSLAKSIAKRH